MLSYLEAWSTMDAEATVAFVLPDHKFSKLDITYKNIKIVYLWDNIPVKNYIIQNVLMGYYIMRFVKNLKSGDNVYIYGDGYILSKITQRKDINVYLEKTEHPEVSNPGHWPFKVSVKTYLSRCKQLKGLFVISNPLKDYFIINGVDRNKIHIVNMTVNPIRFEGIIKQDTGVRYIAYCGKATNNKDGVDRLIKSFSLLSPKHPDLFLYIIGTPPKRNISGNNAELAEKLGVGDKVIFKGVVPYSEMPQVLTNATILALNRPDNLQARYGFPTKLGEYLLTGNPVVVTSVGDIPRFITDKVNGMVSNPNSIEEFAERIEWLLCHPSEAKEIGEKGKLTALSKFNNLMEAKKIVDAMYKG